MKIAIFYFSGTGNSYWASKEIKKMLGERNKVTLYSVENPILNDPQRIYEIVVNIDHLILGYPIYASRMPKPMEEIVNLLPVLKKKLNISVFATQATASGDGAVYFKKVIKEKGYIIRQSVHLKMGNNFYIPHLRISPVKGDKHLKKLNNDAQNKIVKFCNSISLNRKDNIFVNPFGKLLGIIQRAFYFKTMEVVSRDLSVNKTLCNNCDFCIKNCPTNNIYLENDEVKFKNHCISCVRCYNYCPKTAILLGVQTKDHKTFYRYKGPEKIPITKIRGIFGA